MIINEYQMVKSNKEIFQERDIECKDWETYINEYILNPESNNQRTFSRKCRFIIMDVSNNCVYAEYRLPLDGTVICHQSKIIKE